MKAAERAPSPKRRRKRFGRVKATVNAVETRPAPKNRAARLSRTTPRIRLPSVSRLISFAWWTNVLAGFAGSAGAAGGVMNVSGTASLDIRFLFGTGPFTGLQQQVPPALTAS